MSAIRASTVLALWANAYAAGQVSGDDMLAAVSHSGFVTGVRADDAKVAQRHQLPGPGQASTGVIALLELFRGTQPCELVLPIAGDTRGLPPSRQLAVASLDAGAAIILRDKQIAAVAQHGLWRIFDVGVEDFPRSLPWSVLDAELAIDNHLAHATKQLQRLDIARESATVRADIARAMREAALDSPPTIPRRARTLLAKVISLEALLKIATSHQTAAISRHELGAIDDALKPLHNAVRQGRLAAVAAASQRR